ncbi:protein GLUTAMINE DUMPER 4-like [Mangifera indica]|uniref:protein GLUTAMINE DUMPER 4-like n=1 Tax=Mangifera indica TaxID=29780 RepID=UPI001CFC250C|nr:protein GLUTAMINE DUMPER 4-like [Mangifera indica]
MTAGGNIWQSPIPYLFGGLGCVLLLIASALIFLACSYRKSFDSGDDHDQENPPSLPLKPLDPEPKIVVIMAGDDKPTHLATPAISSNTCCCDQPV